MQFLSVRFWFNLKNSFIFDMRITLNETNHNYTILYLLIHTYFYIINMFRFFVKLIFIYERKKFLQPNKCTEERERNLFSKKSIYFQSERVKPSLNSMKLVGKFILVLWCNSWVPLKAILYTPVANSSCYGWWICYIK